MRIPSRSSRTMIAKKDSDRSGLLMAGEHRAPSGEQRFTQAANPRADGARSENSSGGAGARKSHFYPAEFGLPGLAPATLDAEGRFRTVSRAFASLFGFEPGELEGTRWSEMVVGEDRAAVEESLSRLAKSQELFLTLECRHRTKSGGARRSSIAILRIPVGEGSQGGQPLMVFDVSRSRQWEEERGQLERQLLQAQKMESLGRIAGGLAHDFNNFLEVILGVASLARLHLSPGDELFEPLEMIEDSARRASDLTSQLLGLMQEDQSQEESCDPGDALRRVLKIIRRTFDRRIRIESHLSTGLPWVRADGRRLEQAVLNLAINARDAMPEGGVLTVEASRLKVGQDDPSHAGQNQLGDYVQVVVQDTGVGMEASVMERIFDPLFTTKPPGEGTGLGLTMVRKIVHDAGGFVRVESHPGQGSRFILNLPVAPARQVAGGENETPALVLGRGTVLVVDDEPLVLAFVQRGLKRLGYRALVAENGKKACDLYAAYGAEIDCVLLDMIMPEMSGLETFARLKALNPDVRVILTSGYSRKGAGDDISDADFLGKPYSLEALSLALRRTRNR